MKWLTNEYDPFAKDAKHRLSLRLGESREGAWSRYQQWLSDKIIGEPLETEHRTVDELKRQNLVGIYSRAAVDCEKGE
jgi:hypothetical protein